MAHRPLRPTRRRRASRRHPTPTPQRLPPRPLPRRRAWELKEALRDLYHHVPPELARPYLQRWITSATRSRTPAFVNLARTIRHNLDGIIAAVELDLSNSRLEGINGKIRLIQRRGYGYHSVDSLAAAIHLCLGGITIQLPTRP